MSLNLQGVSASSGLSGLIDRGPVSGSVSINGLTLPTGGGVSGQYNIPLVFPDNSIISLINIHVTGATASISDYWFPLTGNTTLYDFPNKFSIYNIVQSASNGRNVAIQLRNQTAASSVTVPNLTIEVNAHMFSYPF